jgi:hypothetical protein
MSADKGACGTCGGDRGRYDYPVEDSYAGIWHPCPDCTPAVDAKPTSGVEPLKSREEIADAIESALAVNGRYKAITSRALHNLALDAADAILSRGIAKAEVDEEKLAEAMHEAIVKESNGVKGGPGRWASEVCARVAVKMMGGK